jgi:uncharacterized protein
MKLHRELNIGQNTITAYGDGHIDVNGQRRQASLLVLPQKIQENWGQTGFEQLTTADFRPVIELGCEILIIGTGRRQRFPSPGLLRELIEARIGVEIMDTGAACRTFNILVTEGRNVAAALLIEP